MRTIHAWDCPSCGTRNAPAFVHCRRCDAPQSQGRPVAGDDPRQVPFTPAVSQSPVAVPWGLVKLIGIPALCYLFLRFAPWDLVLSTLAVLSFVSWPALIVIAILLTLLRIARGVERMGR